MVNRCLAEAVTLGAQFIRIDIRWQDVLPDGEHVDESAWEWYESYINAAIKWYGLSLFVVLFNPPECVSRASVADRLVMWERYVSLVAGRLGDRCRYYQILNEPNNPVFSVFRGSSLPTAIRVASKVIRHHSPKARTAINVLADLPGWLASLERTIGDTGDSIDIIGIDHYPETWTVSWLSPISDWSRLGDRLAGRLADVRSPLNGRPVAILETGYSTNVPLLRNDEAQVRYLSSLSDGLKFLDSRLPHGLAFVGIYELADGDSNAGVDPESHFGLIESDSLARKPAFGVVQTMLSRFPARNEPG